MSTFLARMGLSAWDNVALGVSGELSFCLTQVKSEQMWMELRMKQHRQSFSLIILRTCALIPFFQLGWRKWHLFSATSQQNPGFTSPRLAEQLAGPGTLPAGGARLNKAIVPCCVFLQMIFTQDYILQHAATISHVMTSYFFYIFN